jgi:SAM-dependent methyltransferase
VNRIRHWLLEPRVRGVNVDDNALLDIHSAILREKALLRSTFATFYRDMAALCDRWLDVPGIEVELGTGAGFFKTLRPNLVTSDVRRGPNIDLEIDAQAMALEDRSVRCVYAINVFHHLPDPDRFFAELTRILAPGGGCILIEPHGGPASAWLHRRLHTDEAFLPDAPDWRNAEIGGPLSGANQALAHIVFQRDRARFEATHGAALDLVHQGYELNGLRYLLSGGLNFRQLVPDLFETPLAQIERLAAPLARWWSLHQAVVLRRRA